MQPLALQPLPSPIDAGDASNAGPPHSNNSGVVFNDLMSAARKAANEEHANEEAKASRRASDEIKASQKERDAESSLEALAAAAQFASRNVRTRQRAIAEEKSHAEASNAAAAHRLSAQDDKTESEKTVDCEVPTPSENTPMAKGAAAQATDQETPSSPNSINVKTEDPSTNPDTAPDAETLTPPATQTRVSNSQTTAPINTAAAASSTQLSNNEASTTDEVNGTKDEDLQADKPASATSIALNAVIKETPDPVEGPAADDVAQTSAQQAQATPKNQISPTKLAIEAGQTETLTQTAQDSPTDLEPSKKDGEDDAGSSTNKTQKTETTDLQAAGNTPLGGIMEPTPIKSPNEPVPPADPVLSQTREQKTVELTTVDPPTGLEQSPTQLATSTGAANPESTEHVSKTASSQAFEIRSINKFQAGGADSSDQINTAMQDDMNPPETSSDGDGSPRQQFTDQNSLAALKAKADAQSTTAIQTSSTRVGGVEIEELKKLGVKEASMSSSPKATTTEPTQDLSSPTPAPTVTAQTQAQSPAFTPAEAGASTERRTIAADIRLRALERMVVAAARAGTDTITLQLYPPALGQVMIRLVMDGQRLRIMTRAANAEAVNTLKDMEGDIRDALATHGLDLADFDVTDEQQEESQAQRQKSAEPAIQTKNGGKSESFTVDLNA